MKTILVIYYDWNEVMDEQPTNDEDIYRWLFKARKYNTEGHALSAYANTMCTWSTLLDEDANVKDFMRTALEHIKAHDYDWLEANFT